MTMRRNQVNPAFKDPGPGVDATAARCMHPAPTVRLLSVRAGSRGIGMRGSGSFHKGRDDNQTHTG